MLEHIKLEKIKKKALEILKEKELEISTLKATLEVRKSLSYNDLSDLTNKCEVIQKIYYDLQEIYNVNHDKMKNLKEQLKNSAIARSTPLTIHLIPHLIRLLKFLN